MTRSRRTALRPSLEPVEGRALLSALTYLAATSARPVQVTAGLLEARQAAQANGTVPARTTVASSPFAGSSGIGGQGQGASPLIGTGQPTAREIARDTFKAFFNGPLLIGPGRFSDQANIIYVRGVGSTTFFHHGDMNMGIVIPRNLATPITGEINMQDKNINSGGQVAFQLTAVPGAVDPRGRPTQFTFVADPNIYSGIFFFDSATGILGVNYHGSTATVRITGLVYTSGLTNPIKNTDLVQRGGVPFGRS